MQPEAARTCSGILLACVDTMEKDINKKWKYVIYRIGGGVTDGRQGALFTFIWRPGIGGAGGDMCTFVRTWLRVRGTYVGNARS